VSLEKGHRLQLPHPLAYPLTGGIAPAPQAQVADLTAEQAGAGKRATKEAEAAQEEARQAREAAAGAHRHLAQLQEEHCAATTAHARVRNILFP